MTEAQRSYNMSRIKGKDTSIETILRRELHRRGVRFRKNSNRIYGHPDISIEKYKIAIFCDGDFWHGYNWEEREASIKSNRDYWIPKIERNMEKDIEVNHVLSYLGYTVIRVWEHEIKKDLDKVCDMIISYIEKAKEERMIKIRKARRNEKEDIYAFYDNLIDSMQTSQYSPGWKKGIYPTKEDLSYSVDHGELYIMKKDNILTGAMEIDSRPTEGYEKAGWKLDIDPSDAAIIHKLAILPMEQGKGEAKRLVDYAIKEARRLGKKAIRLDVYKPNLPAAKLYISKGFTFIETIELYYEDTGLTEYDLFELDIR